MNSASSTPVSRPQLAHEDVAHRAQELWEKEGRPTGRDEAIWFEAERSLHSQTPAVPVSAPATAPAPSLLSARTPPPTQASATAKMPPLRAPKKPHRDL